MKTILANHPVRWAPPDFMRWLGPLLLVVLGGCRGPAIISDYRATNAAELIGASAVFSPPLAEKSPAASAHRASKTKPVVRLASFESELAPAPIRSLELTDAINISLQRNPDLRAVRASEPVAHAAYHVAQTYPFNPQFQTQVLPYSRDRNGNDGALNQQHVLMQTFEMGGQRRFRVGMAAASWEQVNGVIRQAELLNAAQTTRLFFAAIYQRELRDMNQLLADLNEQLVGVIQRRQNAGQANSADVALARLQSQSSDRQQRLSEASYQTALMLLRNQLNFDANAPLELSRNWLDWKWRSLGETISPGDSNAALFESVAIGETKLRQLVVDRPDVASARAAAAMAAENLGLAKAMRRPNLQIGPMWQRDESSTEFWGVQGQINIPIINTGKPLVAQRFAELRLQQITAAQLENRAVLEARAAIQRYERARILVEESRAEFAQDISSALQPFEEQFKAGQITLLQVFAARAAFAQSRQSFLALLNELTLAVADLTQATGQSAQQLIVPQPIVPQSSAADKTETAPAP